MLRSSAIWSLGATLRFSEVSVSRSLLISEMASFRLGEVPSPWSSLAVPGVRRCWTSWSTLLLELLDSAGIGEKARSLWLVTGEREGLEEVASDRAKSW